MAEVLVSAVLEQLLSFTGERLQQEWSLIRGVETELKSLTSNLEAIQAVLEDAEKKQIKNASVRHWLHRLKQVSFQIDAVLDEWNTAVLRSKKEHPSSKVCPFGQSSCFHLLDQVQSACLLPYRVPFTRKIKELNEELNNIAIERERYMFSTKNYNRNSIETTRAIEYAGQKKASLIVASEVHGREIEKSVLVSKLLSESSQAESSQAESSQAAGSRHNIIPVVPIVGMGGIGKTTLAQLVYKDEKVVAHFDLRLWVCVSDPFDEMRVCRAITEALRVKDAHNLVESEAFLQCIQESITRKRFLLVLDDVWTEDYREWEQLEISLGCGAIGSKILVTTRNVNVAIMMKAKKNMISITHLSEEVSWSIFSQHAFVNIDNEKRKEFEEIGRQIANKSKGLPLVAKTLGSLISFNNSTKEQWEKVLHSELWELERISNEVFIPLLVSYYDLPPLDKCCFLYCSYFPKDYTISRDELVQLWTSEGYLDSKKNYERKGVDCFENLARRSLFQDFIYDEDGDLISCKMHDIVHDFTLFLSKNEWLNVLIDSNEKNTSLVEEKALFHCTLLLESEAQIPIPLYNKKDLRTLSVTNLGGGEVLRWDILLKLTCLRTLTLHSCNFSSLPKKIDKLVHLRYLSLSNEYNSVIKVPRSLCNLFNLQTLKLGGCVRELPKGIHKLVNLRHLYLRRWIRVPRGLKRLTCLETLDSLSVDGFYRAAMKLEDLGKLNNLKGSLYLGDIGRVEDAGEAERAKIKEKEDLVELKLYFAWPNSPPLDADEKSTLLLEGLQPHLNLKHLVIEYYYGARVFPSWMSSLVNLKSLRLEFCIRCKFLGPFGKLPSLESLHISEMDQVERIGLEFLGIEANNNSHHPMETMNCSSISFPKLKRLEFDALRSWEEWAWLTGSGLGNEDDSNFIIMPSLVSLQISYCPRLKAPLPSFLRRTPLQHLSIEASPNLEVLCQQEMGTEELVKILTSPTSPTSQLQTDTTGEATMEIRTSHYPEILPQYDHEISKADDDEHPQHL